MLSFVRPLATFASARSTSLLLLRCIAWRRTSAISSSTSIREYQRSRFRIAAKARMLSR